MKPEEPEINFLNISGSCAENDNSQRVVEFQNFTSFQFGNVEDLQQSRSPEPQTCCFSEVLDFYLPLNPSHQWRERTQTDG